MTSTVAPTLPTVHIRSGWCDNWVGVQQNQKRTTREQRKELFKTSPYSKVRFQVFGEDLRWKQSNHSGRCRRRSARVSGILVTSTKLKGATMIANFTKRSLSLWVMLTLLMLSSAPMAQENGTLSGLLRRTLESIQRGSPNLSDMEPLTADAVEKQNSAVQPMLMKMGSITKITYRGIQSMPGTSAEAYKVQFANGSMTWAISKGASGKIQILWTPGPDN